MFGVNAHPSYPSAPAVSHLTLSMQKMSGTIILETFGRLPLCSSIRKENHMITKSLKVASFHLILYVPSKPWWWMSPGLKEKFIQTWKCIYCLLFSMLMEMFIVHKNFWSFTASQCCIILLNNWSKWGFILKCNSKINKTFHWSSGAKEDMYSLQLFTIAIQLYVNPLITICKLIFVVSSGVIHSFSILECCQLQHVAQCYCSESYLIDTKVSVFTLSYWSVSYSKANISCCFWFTLKSFDWWNMDW